MIVDRRAGLDIGVDSTAGAELAGMQVRQLLEPNDDITIRFPPLFMDVVGQVSSESARREIRIGAHLLKVVHTEGNDVFVGCQKAISAKWPDAVVGFTAQQSLNLLRDNRSPEHSGKRIADGRLESALDPRGEPLLATHACALARTCRGISPGARQTSRPRVASPKHGIGTPRRCVTVRILRITSMLVKPGPSARRPGTEQAWGGHGRG